MNMQNPYEDLIKIIDIILEKVELGNEKVIGLLITDFPATNGPVHPASRIKFFQRLKESGAIEDFDVMKLGRMPHGFTLTQPNKQKLLEERKRLVNSDQQSTKLSSMRSPMPTTLYLNSVGDFWREPKEKYCYPIGETSSRHKIVRFLATHSGYQKTSDIAVDLEGKDEQLVRKEIGKIRGNIKKFLKLNGEDVIEMRRGSGYKIGPSYKIMLKN